MSRIKEYRFCDLYKMSSGISTKPAQAGHGYPFVSFSTVFNNFFLPKNVADLMDTSPREQEIYSLRAGDILLTRTSETIDELGMSCVVIDDFPNATYSGFLKRLRPIQGDVTYPKFMGFYLRSKLFRKTMTNNAVLTLRASLNEEIFSYLKLYVPDFNTQKRIGDFLYALSNKIELNNRINAELEAMAKLIYDYWFVQFDFPISKEQAKAMGNPKLEGKPYKASGGKMVLSEELKRDVPDGWGVKSLIDIECNIVTGKTPPTNNETFFGGDVPFITIGDIRGNMHVVSTELRLTKSGADFQANKFIPPGALCVSCIASPGLIGFATQPSQTNQQINSIIFEEECNKSYLYFALNDFFKFSKGAKTGNTFANMNKGDFSSIKLVTPNLETREDFHRTATPFFQKILSTSLENQKLTDLRDWLLPILMNGQVKIKDVEEKQVDGGGAVTGLFDSVIQNGGLCVGKRE